MHKLGLYHGVCQKKDERQNECFEFVPLVLCPFPEVFMTVIVSTKKLLHEKTAAVYHKSELKCSSILPLLLMSFSRFYQYKIQ